MKITIGIPTASALLHRKFVQSLMSLQFPMGTDADINIVEGYQLPFARNRIVQHALESNSEYLLFIDADMIFPPDAFKRLLFHNVDIVNALAFRRTAPHYPCIFNWADKNNCYITADYSGCPEGLLKVDACGMPCILIKTKVFKKMKQPWYYYRDNQFSSDLTFCWEAKKLGYDINIDTSLKIGHIGEECVVDETFYLNNLKPNKRDKWNAGMKEYIIRHEKENSPTV